jgi:ubiquinone/menaquinone biosynthesis C-methylase UbiE
MEEKLDLNWDDDHVVPPTIYPDLEFLFRQTPRLVFQEVNAKQGEYVLDIGCGRAIDAVELSKNGAITIGLEPSGVMLYRAKEQLAEANTTIALFQGMGEALPFKSCFFDKVMCKGALDHFISPSKTMEEISRVLKPEGEMIIAIANFESLGFRIGKKVTRLKVFFGAKAEEQITPWVLPVDHTYKFDYKSLRDLVKGNFQIKSIKGISLLWGMPWWGSVLSKLPSPIRNGILRALDKVARLFPSLADIIVVKGVPFSERK